MTQIEKHCSRPDCHPVFPRNVTFQHTHKVASFSLSLLLSRTKLHFHLPGFFIFHCSHLDVSTLSPEWAFWIMNQVMSSHWQIPSVASPWSRNKTKPVLRSYMIWPLACVPCLIWQTLNFSHPRNLTFKLELLKNQRRMQHMLPMSH